MRMIYVYLLLSGLIVSVVHAYLVKRNSNGVRYSISEHAIADKHSYVLYIVAHLATDILFAAYSYMFFYEFHGATILFGLSLVFILLDFVQAILPSKGKLEKLHFGSAYISWFTYILVGVLALFLLNIAKPYFTLAITVIIPVLAMFTWMHFKRKKLWPFQLLIVPLYFLFLYLITVGSIL